VHAVQATPLVSRSGQVVGTLATHGMAPHAWTERELRLLDMLSREAADFIERAKADEQLKEADRRKDEFLAILAHELRNPLAPIRYAISIAREAGSSEQQRRRAESVIDRQVAHMGRLLDDLLDVSRIARGTVQLRRQQVSLEAVVQAATEAARPLVEAKAHELVVTGLAATTVDVDPVRITQVLTNLLNNAAKYTEPRGRIELAFEIRGADLAIRVSDNGMGLAEEVRPRLFTLFAQAQGAAQRAEGGLGIGLALVKGFVELHGGSVAAQSEGSGRGTCFTVALPGAVVQPVQAAPEPGNGRMVSSIVDYMSAPMKA
jgi:signal transduction histidine kinase